MPVTYRDFSAWITSDGAELETYKPSVEGGDGRTLTCWIPSEEGKKFQVHWMDHNGGIATVGHIYFDGSSRKATNGAILLGTIAGETKTVMGVQVSNIGIKPFLFTKLEVTEDESIASGLSSELGSVRISITRVTVTQSDSGGHHQDIHSQGPVHEKSKKGGSHIVGYGREEPTGIRPAFVSCQPYDLWDKKPYVTFLFRYRSLALLQANNIAPPPVKSENDQIRRLQTQGNAVVSQGKRKLESVPPRASSFKRVKAEEPQPKPKPREVIDLTWL